MGRYRVVNKEEEKLYRDENLEDTKCEDIRKNFFGDCPHAGNQKTPYFLCKEITDKLPDLNGKNILILFNPELYYVIKKYYDGAKFTFITGSKKMSKVKLKNAKLVYCNPFDFEKFSEVVKNMKKFDVIIGNPPYQDSSNERNPLWEKFVEKSFELCDEEGYISLIHPSAWRKPIHKLFQLFQKFNLKYLEIHNQQDGLKTFGAGTRYDWYVLEKEHNKGKTIIIDELGNKIECDISKMNCIPHQLIDFFISLLAKENEERCEVIFSYSSYETRKEWMSEEETEEFKYPCVHATKSKGIRIVYSSLNNKGHFGVKKVIMGMASPENGFYDVDGKYGMTQHNFAIRVNDDEEGHSIEKILKTDKFKEFGKLCKWSGFQTDHRAFSLFRKDFWKEFI